MFVKNYSNAELVVNYKGLSTTLLPYEVSYVDDSWISFSMLKMMYGDYIFKLHHDTPIEEFLSDNQILAEFDKIYSVELIEPSLSTMFIKNGKINIYFDDSEEAPSNKEEMSLFKDYSSVSGFLPFQTIPKYVMFEKVDNLPEVILTNIKVTEL